MDFYSVVLCWLVYVIGDEFGVEWYSVVYVGFLGFSFEIFVEICMLWGFGVGLVGMLMVLEVIVCQYLGMCNFGFFFIINFVVGMIVEIGYEEIYVVGECVQLLLQSWFEEIVCSLKLLGVEFL